MCEQMHYISATKKNNCIKVIDQNRKKKQNIKVSSNEDQYQSKQSYKIKVSKQNKKEQLK